MYSIMASIRKLRKVKLPSKLEQIVSMHAVALAFMEDKAYKINYLLLLFKVLVISKYLK